MVGALIKKEIQANVLSFRFVAVAALLLIVVPVTVLVLSTDAAKKVDEFSSRRSEIETYLKSYAHFNRLQNVVKPAQPPLASYALVRGISSDVNFEEFDDDPLPVMFPLLDLTFVVAILLSLAALIFSYDAVCGEKEDGTLKLMLANGLPRAKIILAKIIGGTVTLIVPFLLSLVLGLIVILLNPRITWKGADWTSLAFLLIGAGLYVLFFQVLGVFISVRHHSSSASIMTSLCVWVLFVLVVPNLSPYFAALVSPSPSRIKVSREMNRLTDVERDDLGRRLADEKMRELTRTYPALAENLSQAEAKVRAEKDPAYKIALQARVREVGAAWDEANRIQIAKANALQDNLERQEEAQTKLSGTLSMVSPLADFTYLSSDLTSTGLMNERHFKRLSDIWGRSYGDYRQAKIVSLQKKDPAVDWWNTPVDVSDMSRFVYKEEDLAARLKGTLPAFAVLAGLALAAFWAAYFSFRGYDAR
jgi:ABC-type transport system involved in multi-copper enzyme maturation permease subunit